MDVNQFGAAWAAASASLPGGAAVVFSFLSAKAAGDETTTVNSISKVGDVVRVYPVPATTIPAHIVIEIA